MLHEELREQMGIVMSSSGMPSTADLLAEIARKKAEAWAASVAREKAKAEALKIPLAKPFQVAVQTGPAGYGDVWISAYYNAPRPVYYDLENELKAKQQALIMATPSQDRWRMMRAIQDPEWGKKYAADLPRFDANTFLLDTKLRDNLKPEFRSILDFLKRPGASTHPTVALKSMSVKELQNLQKSINQLQRTPPRPGYSWKDHESMGVSSPLLAYREEYVYGTSLMQIANMLMGRSPRWWKGQVEMQSTGTYPFLPDAIEEKLLEEEERIAKERMRKETEKSDLAWNKYLQEALKRVDEQFAISKKLLGKIYEGKTYLAGQLIEDESIKKKLALGNLANQRIAEIKAKFDRFDSEQEIKKSLIEKLKTSASKLAFPKISAAIRTILNPIQSVAEKAEERRGAERLLAPCDRGNVYLTIAEAKMTMEQIAKRDLLLNLSGESLKKRVIAVEKVVEEKIPKAREEVGKIIKHEQSKTIAPQAPADFVFKPGYIPYEPKEITITPKLKEGPLKILEKMIQGQG